MYQKNKNTNYNLSLLIFEKTGSSDSLYPAKFSFPDLIYILTQYYSYFRIWKAVLVTVMLIAVIQTVSAQTTHCTRNNYTGDWETSVSWNPLWDKPLTSVNASNITINGYISCNGPLTFSSVDDTLRVNDTLVVFGDMRMGNATSLLINKNAILIVRGNFISVNMSMIKTDTNAFFVVTGDFIRSGTLSMGSFNNTTCPTGVFIGGSVDSSYLGAPSYPVFDCPGNIPYSSSGCSYGNMTDLMNSSLSSFLESTCTSTIATAGPDQSVCSNSSVKLSGNTPDIGTGLWTIESGIGGNIVKPDNPKSQFNGTTGTTYILRWAIIDGPCISSDEVTITINSTPAAKLSVSDNTGISLNDGIICSGDTAQLIASGGINYNWSTGETTAEIKKDTAGSYYVIVTDTNGCSDTASVLIMVNPLPQAGVSIIDNSGSMQNDGLLCAGDTALLIASGGINYSWSTGETNNKITTNREGTYSVSVSDTNACVTSIKNKIEIISLPVADAGTDDISCGPEYKLNALSVAGSGFWSVSQGPIDAIFFPGKNDPASIVTISSYGSYIFTWKVVNEGCQASADVMINFHEPLAANAGKDQALNHIFTASMGAGLDASSTGEWKLLSGAGVFNDINSPDTRVSGLSPGKNLFVWTVNDGYCLASDTMVIDVNDLFVPQVITPNNDNKNDFFVIKDIEENAPVALTVFNRWGSEVYSSNDYSNDWDGRNKYGTELPEDTYFYVLKFADGIVKKGFVLIKR